MGGYELATLDPVSLYCASGREQLFVDSPGRDITAILIFVRQYFLKYCFAMPVGAVKSMFLQLNAKLYASYVNLGGDCFSQTIISLAIIYKPFSSLEQGS